MLHPKVRQVVTSFTWLNAAYQAYFRYRGKLNKAKRCRRLRRFGEEILDKIYARLKDKDIVYFADYGTLLGIVREHDFIRHDDDVDFSAVGGTFDPCALVEWLDGWDGFTFSHAFEYRGQIAQITFLYHEIEVDFFFTYRQNGMNFSPVYERRSGVLYPDRESWSAFALERPSVGKLNVVDFLRTKVIIPENFDELLTNRYGSWRIPVANWRSDSDSGQKKWVLQPDFSRKVDKHRVFELGHERHCVI